MANINIAKDLGQGIYTKAEADTKITDLGDINHIIGTDTDLNTNGSTIIDNIYVTDGVITSMGTRTLGVNDLITTGGRYYVDNGNNALITGESIIGDTSVSLVYTNVACSRVGNTATISGRLQIGAFSKEVPTDLPMNFIFNLESIAQTQGWFTNITTTTYGTASYEFSGDGFDLPAYSVKIYGATDGLHFISGETDVGNSGATVTNLYATFSIVILVN